MFIRNNPYKNLIFVFFTMYQSWHYAMQSYGTSEYFQKKVNQTTGISKFFYLFIGFYFFKNTITTYLNLLGDTFLLKRLSFLTHSPFLNDLVCLLLTLGIVLIWYKKQKRDLSKISQLTTLVWILWAVFAKFPFFYFFLPALHSLQYFFFLKINKRKKLNVIFFTAFCSTLIGVIILLSYHQNNLYRIELMTTLILILNSLHILTDSQGWKHV